MVARYPAKIHNIGLKKVSFAGMKIVLLQVGKTRMPFVQAGESEYAGRIRRMQDFDQVTVPAVRKSGDGLKRAEGEALLKRLGRGDYVVLLDERGRTMTSSEFAQFLEARQMARHRRLVFVIGGAYGFSPELYARADKKLSLSAMTFSHQLVRLIFLEQLYRALTIMKNLPYHHE